jgi:uroporphyrinogen decarboxylase
MLSAPTPSARPHPLEIRVGPASVRDAMDRAAPARHAAEPGWPRSPFLAATRGERVGHTPVWFMRQAGRSLPEYRSIRGDGSILEAIKQPELAAEITLQPVLRYGVDAAVLFSDIVVPAHAVGFGIDVAPGTGPVAERPLRSSADLTRLRPLALDDVDYVVATVDRLVAELTVPLLAFAGAPFTVASYLIEGGPSKDYRHTKALIHENEVLWHELMERLTESAITFVDAQLSHGSAAFQLFDSWAGALSRRDYDRFALPYSRRVFDELRERHPTVPGIHFGVGCDHLLESMYAAGPAVIGLDWRTTIGDARRRLGADVAVQGNLDPALVLAGATPALAGAARVVHDNRRADGSPHPGHIFNLGHGVNPDSDPAVLQDIVALVHERTAVGQSKISGSIVPPSGRIGPENGAVEAAAADE